MPRYSAHLPLTGIGAAGQQRIREAHVVLIGVGGLGCAVAQYLVSSGIGQLTLCDFDTVAESNLARQILYRQTDLGRLKVEAASDALQNLNPETRLQSINRRMTDADMQALFPACDLVIDASDNYGTRLAVNRNCLSLKIPWIMASCIRMEGQIMLMRPDLPAHGLLSLRLWLGSGYAGRLPWCGHIRARGRYQRHICGTFRTGPPGRADHTGRFAPVRCRQLAVAITQNQQKTGLQGLQLKPGVKRYTTHSVVATESSCDSACFKTCQGNVAHLTLEG